MFQIPKIVRYFLVVFITIWIVYFGVLVGTKIYNAPMESHKLDLEVRKLQLENQKLEMDVWLSKQVKDFIEAIPQQTPQPNNSGFKAHYFKRTSTGDIIETDLPEPILPPIHQKK